MQHSNVVSIRPLQVITVSADHEGWHVRMGETHKTFWQRDQASAFVDWLLERHLAVVQIEGELHDG